MGYCKGLTFLSMCLVQKMLMAFCSQSGGANGSGQLLK